MMTILTKLFIQHISQRIIIRFYPNKHRTITFRISYFNLLYRFDSNELNFALHLLNTKSIVLHPQ